MTAFRMWVCGIIVLVVSRYIHPDFVAVLCLASGVILGVARRDFVLTEQINFLRGEIADTINQIDEAQQEVK